MEAPRRSESGHLIVGVAILIAVLLIMLTAAAQSWTFLLKRDREAELIFRGEQYARAIQFYRKEMNQWPLQLDALVEQGPHRHGFIRRLWPDPVSKDGEWGLLYLSPTGKGFLNPYASQGAQIPGMPGGGDPFGNPLGQPEIGPLGQPTRGSSSGPFGGRNSSRNKSKEGYTEISREELERKGISGMNLPIVGVVHKKMEEGLKIYKGFSTLNDWAFTLMGEGQEQNRGARKMFAPPTKSTRKQGVGDSQFPIMPQGVPSDVTEEETGCSGNPREVQECLARIAEKTEGDVPPAHCNSTDPNYDPKAIDCIPYCRPANKDYDPENPKCISYCYPDDPYHDPNAPECLPDRGRGRDANLDPNQQ